MSRPLRIGVDVGGTFTDVVALDARTRELVASVKVPTTHAHARGVAAGIVEGIERLLRESGVDPSDVGFIAHSTTQATNALLEGDLARVGVVGLLDGLGWLARPQIAFRPFDVAAGARFAPDFRFARAASIDGMREAVETLRRAGCEAFAASQPFGVDDRVAESRCVAFARERGLPATSGHEVSSMYGLRARTRTAALNAAILPKMIETARMTGAAVQAAKIETPLMIMRSDGGVMNARDVERRPILTLLSGPAAGVAGALLHESVTDGVFIEVGGTSSDCSAIRAGRPQMRSANIGGHQTMLRTVDVRTLGIGGGSLARVPEHGCVDAGPRSAHIAGLRYATFCALEVFDGASVTRFSPTAHDPADYVQILARDGTKIGVTVTCAANALGLVPRDAFAAGSEESARRAFALVAERFGGDGDTLARAVLDRAALKVSRAIEELAFDYALEARTLTLVGGGGGAAALLPAVAQRGGYRYRTARNAEVISPIGVALALVQDSIERTIVNPSRDDIVQIRRAAEDAAIAAGADPAEVDVSIELDPRRNIVRAIASGAGALAKTPRFEPLDPVALERVAARMLEAGDAPLERVAATESLLLFSIRRAGRAELRVLDMRGVARLALTDASVVQTRAGSALPRLRDTLESQTSFGDVGRALPRLYVLHGPKVTDLSGFAEATQVLALAEEELRGVEPSAPITFVTVRQPAS